jgi:hypothetical protein
MIPRQRAVIWNELKRGETRRLFESMATLPKALLLKTPTVYIADLHHDGLLKIGATNNVFNRIKLLQLELGEPKITVVFCVLVPIYWGTHRDYEKRLLALLPRGDHPSKSNEIVRATPDEAVAALKSLVREWEQSGV